MTDKNCKAASKRDQCEARIEIDEREQARTHRVQLMMLDIDGILTRYEATAIDILAAAQALATSAVGDLANKGNLPDTLHKAADAIAEQIREALHKRIDEGERDDWLIER